MTGERIQDLGFCQYQGYHNIIMLSVMLVVTSFNAHYLCIKLNCVLKNR